MSNYIEDWISQVCESEKTKDAYQMHVRIFIQFCQNQCNRYFGEIVKEWRRVRRISLDSREDFLEEWSDIVRSFHTYLQTKKYAPLTVKNFLVTLRSFFKFWGIPIKVRLPKKACVIYHNRDLTREDVKLILTNATPRDRTIWLVMAESGLRVSTAIGSKYWQIKEDFEKEKVPMRILLPSASLKDHVGDRWTFIGEDGFRHLKDYLQQRFPLKDEDYVFASEKPGKVEGDQFSISSLSVKFGRLVQKLGMCESRNGHPKAIRQHGLRKYFRNNMKCESAYREFWMGHSLGTDAHYITRDVETHRQEYAKGYPHLRVYEPMDPSSLGLIQKQAQQLHKQKVQIEKLEMEVRELKETLEFLEKSYPYVSIPDDVHGEERIRILERFVRSMMRDIEEIKKSGMDFYERSAKVLEKKKKRS